MDYLKRFLFVDPCVVGVLVGVVVLVVGCDLTVVNHAKESGPSKTEYFRRQVTLFKFLRSIQRQPKTATQKENTLFTARASR